MKTSLTAFIAVAVVLIFGCTNITTMAQSSEKTNTADSAQADTTTSDEVFRILAKPHEVSSPIKDTSTLHVEIKHYYQECEIYHAHLSESYPQPCLADTLYIGYHVPECGRVKLEIFNLLGQLLDVIVDEDQHQGNHEVRLKFLRETTSPGIYFYKISIGGDYSDTKKLTILR